MLVFVGIVVLHYIIILYSGIVVLILSRSSFPEEEDDDHPPIPDPTHRSYILLTAPTGKAAKVLGSRTGYTGFTLHQACFTPFSFYSLALFVQFVL